MNSNRDLYTEERFIEAVKRLLSGRVNELLGALSFPIPLIEFSDYAGSDVVVPVIKLESCEQSEKERIIRLEAYTMTVAFSVPKTADSELYCYAYSAALCTAIDEEVTLGGVVDRVVITGKKYTYPKNAYHGEVWQVVITLRLTIEEIK